MSNVVLTYSNNNTLEFVTNTSSGSTFAPSITKTGNAAQLWEFGDLSGGTSANTNSPSYVYSMNGNKNVRLTVDNASEVTRINLHSTNIVGTLDTRNFNNVTIFSAITNSNLTQILNPTSSAQYSFYYAYSNNLIGNLDMSPLSSLGGEFQVFFNPNLTSITNPVSSKIFTYYYAHTCNLTGTLNLSGLTGLGGNFRVNNNSLLTNIIFPNSSQTFSVFWAYSCNLTGNLNLSTLSGLGSSIQVYLNPNLTGITFPTSSQVISYFDISQNNLTGNVNLSTLSNLGGQCILRSNANMTGLTLPNTSQNIFNFSVFSCNIIGDLSLTGLTNLNTRLLVPYNANLTGVTLPTNSNTITTFSGQGSTLSNINFTSMTAFTSVNNCNIALQDNGMSATVVNTMLGDLDTITTLGSLVNYYKLDGNANDSVGTATGTGTSIVYSAGKINSGATFNGTTSQIVIPQQINMNNSFSINFWFYQTNYSASDGWNWLYNFNNYGYSGVTGSGALTIATHFRQVRCSFGDWFTNVPSNYASQPLLALNSWHMLTFVRNGNTLYTYANGLPYGSGITTTASTIPTSGTAYIGRGPNISTSMFSGQTDEFGIWNKALTQSEITQLYNVSGGTQYPFFTGRTIDISGTNAAPTGAGLTAKTSLQGKGFTVTTN